MSGLKMSESKRKIPKKKEKTMFWKYIKDLYGAITLIKERLDKIEKTLTGFENQFKLPTTKIGTLYNSGPCYRCTKFNVDGKCTEQTIKTGYPWNCLVPLFGDT